MRFIPKQTLLTEAESNPLNNIDLSKDKAYCQAVLGAIASESAAYSEYDQILALEDSVKERTLVDLFHDTLVDIRDEEMKHLSQLTTKVSQVPEMKDAYEAGVKEAETGKEQSAKESVKESTKSKKVVLTEAVQPNRLYNADILTQVVAEYLNADDTAFDVIENVFWRYADDNELEAESVDKALAELRNAYQISDEQLDTIENLILQTEDPIQYRKDDFKSDIDADISTLKDILENESLYSLPAKNRLRKIIQELSELEYDGSKDTGWREDHSIIGGKNPTKRIIA